VKRGKSQLGEDFKRCLKSSHSPTAQGGHTGTDVYNLGTGTGTSVLDMVEAFRAASSHPVPYEVPTFNPYVPL
jgi:UDP-glucose 4-epimerase